MKQHLKYITLFAGAAVLTVVACKKTDYSFGKLTTPTGLTVTAAVQGADATHPAGDGSGNTTVTPAATDALAYKLYFGDGDSAFTNTGSVTHKYHKLGTNIYNISVNAIGTGGATSTMTKQVTVVYNYQIPADIMTGLTNDASLTWVCASTTAGHFGVGPLTTATADYYKAAPNEKPSCAYDDEITFTKTGPSSMTMTVDNKGESFLISASTAFYGQGGPDNCYPISTGGTKELAFGDAVSGFKAPNSTGVQFSVPGNGIVDFGTGGSTYEILSIVSGVMTLRNIGIDGNAWYQILKVK